jgi:hypothetical protein
MGGKSAEKYVYVYYGKEKIKQKKKEKRFSHYDKFLFEIK